VVEGEEYQCEGEVGGETVVSTTTVVVTSMYSLYSLKATHHVLHLIDDCYDKTYT